MNNGLRRIALFPLLLALLQAFIMAPYQHVHLHPSPDHEGQADHDRVRSGGLNKLRFAATNARPNF